MRVAVEFLDGVKTKSTELVGVETWSDFVKSFGNDTGLVIPTQYGPRLIPWTVVRQVYPIDHAGNPSFE